MVLSWIFKFKLPYKYIIFSILFYSIPLYYVRMYVCVIKKKTKQTFTFSFCIYFHIDKHFSTRASFNQLINHSYNILWHYDKQRENKIKKTHLKSNTTALCMWRLLIITIPNQLNTASSLQLFIHFCAFIVCSFVFNFFFFFIYFYPFFGVIFWFGSYICDFFAYILEL